MLDHPEQEQKEFGVETEDSTAEISVSDQDTGSPHGIDLQSFPPEPMPEEIDSDLAPPMAEPEPAAADAAGPEPKAISAAPTKKTAPGQTTHYVPTRRHSKHPGEHDFKAKIPAQVHVHCLPAAVYDHYRQLGYQPKTAYAILGCPPQMMVNCDAAHMLAKGPRFC